MSVMLISIMFVNMTSAAQIKDTKEPGLKDNILIIIQHSLMNYGIRLAEVKFLYMILITI